MTEIVGSGTLVVASEKLDCTGTVYRTRFEPILNIGFFLFISNVITMVSEKGRMCI